MNKYLARPWHLYRREGYFLKYLSECQEQKRSPKLHVGCGNRPIPGWCNIDVAHLNSEVQYVDALKPLPFASASFQYVFSEHFIEHLTLDQGIQFFKEAFRVLRPGGVLRTGTPNLDFICDLREPKNSGHQRYIDYVAESFLPHQPKSYVSSMNLVFYGWDHKFIYSPSFLQEILSKVGFNSFCTFKSGDSQIVELQGIEQHGKSVPPEINELETFVLEARKE